MADVSVPRPFMTIKEAAKYTGLSYKYIRNGCLKGEIAYVPNGRIYMINMPLFMESLYNISVGTKKPL